MSRFKGDHSFHLTVSFPPIYSHSVAFVTYGILYFNDKSALLFGVEQTFTDQVNDVCSIEYLRKHRTVNSMKIYSNNFFDVVYSFTN